MSGAVACAIAAISLGIALPSAFLTMALFWVTMRPILAVPVVLLAIGGGYMVVQFLRERAMKAKRA